MCALILKISANIWHRNVNKNIYIFSNLYIQSVGCLTGCSVWFHFTRLDEYLKSPMNMKHIYLSSGERTSIFCANINHHPLTARTYSLKYDPQSENMLDAQKKNPIHTHIPRSHFCNSFLTIGLESSSHIGSLVCRAPKTYKTQAEQKIIIKYILAIAVSDDILIHCEPKPAPFNITSIRSCCTPNIRCWLGRPFHQVHRQSRRCSQLCTRFATQSFFPFPFPQGSHGYVYDT